MLQVLELQVTQKSKELKSMKTWDVGIFSGQDQKDSDLMNIYFWIEGNCCSYYVVLMFQLLSRSKKDLRISNIACLMDNMYSSYHVYFKIKFLIFVKVLFI